MSRLCLERCAPFAVVLSAVVAHATALAGKFVWLDHAHIEGGLAWVPVAEWPELFTRSFAGTGFYRPLMALHLSADMALSGEPWFLHTVTLAWHALAALSVFGTARTLGSSPRAALIGAVAFGVHPFNTLVASAIAFRSEAMSLVFLLALIVSHVQNKPLFAGLAVVGSALTKETAWLLAPTFVLLLELGGESRVSARSLLAKRRLLLTEVLGFLLATTLRFSFAPPWRAVFAPLAWDEHIGTRLAALGKGFHRALLPWPNTLCDAFPVVSAVNPLSLLGLAGLGLLLFTRVGSRGRRLLLLASLLPCASVVPLMRWWSPHYFYLPLALGALTFCDAVERSLFSRSEAPPRSKRWPAFGLACLALALTAQSVVDSWRFRSDDSLWSYEVAHEPACREGHFYLGEVARRGRDFARAAHYYRRAATPTAGVLAYVDEFSVHQNLGAVELARGLVSPARAAFRQARESAGTPERQEQAAHNLALAELLSLRIDRELSRNASAKVR